MAAFNSLIRDCARLRLPATEIALVVLPAAAKNAKLKVSFSRQEFLSFGRRSLCKSTATWQTGHVARRYGRAFSRSLSLCLEFIRANPIFAVALRTWTTSQSCQRRSSRGGASAWVAGRALTATNWPRGCFTCIKACLPAGTSCCLTYRYESVYPYLFEMYSSRIEFLILIFKCVPRVTYMYSVPRFHLYSLSDIAEIQI